LETTEKNKNREKIFWYSFWGIILILLIIYFSIIFSMSSQNVNLKQNSNQEIILFKITQNLPFILNKISSSEKKELLSSDINKSIDIQIDKLYQPVFEQIPKFVDKHYTVSGEYQEIFAYLFGNISKDIEEIFFKNSGFESEFNSTIDQIIFDSNKIIKNYISSINSEVAQDLRLNIDELKVFHSFANFPIEDLKQRFQTEITLLRTGGVISAGIAGSLFAKMIGKKIAGKMASKVAIKSGSKVLASVSSASAGAITGGAIGSAVPVVGTGAGAVVGGLISGITAWFITDKIVIEVDEYINRNEFQQELTEKIIIQKKELKNTIKHSYSQNLHLIEQNLTQNYKNISVNELMHKN
jgi:uncharacterized membrane protein